MITGLTRVRNESLIIEDTLEHFLGLCDQIILYDDASTDHTVNIAKTFGERVVVIKQNKWLTDREHEETRHRAYLLYAAKMRHADWCLYFDADERIVGQLPVLGGQVSGFRFKLFDGYMTPEFQEDYTGGRLIDLPRMWGPERRDIAMLFRASCAEYRGLDQREPVIKGPVIRHEKAVVKHFGKCISEAQYFETCDYYSNHFPKYSEKWKQRRKIGHLRTDGTSHFGNNLYTWEDLMKLPHYPHL